MGKVRYGFSLVELLAVIAIILILAALLLPSLNCVIDLARFEICKNNVRQMSNGIALYGESIIQ